MLLFLMVFSPPAGVRARAWLARDALALFNPVAVGAALQCEDDWTNLAAEAWRDLDHPVGPESPAVAKALAPARDHLKRSLRRLAKAKGVDTGLFEEPPAAVDAGVSAYCPRCHELFRSVDGECADCPGVARVPMSAGTR